MLNLILAQSELELVPEKIASHPSIAKMARSREKKPTELLLDSNFHHSAMDKIAEPQRRGRPDLIHHTLLLALSSPLNLSGLLSTYVHTRNDEVISIDPKAQIPQSYNRFVGLMEQVLAEKKTPFLTMEKMGVEELIKKTGADYAALLSEGGTRTSPRKLGQALAEKKNPAFMVGGFPHGDFSKEIYALASEQYCIDPEPLKAWAVSTRVIYSYEDAIGLAEKRLGLKGD